jgi:nicotinate-nucleotide adenylyltransferase
MRIALLGGTFDPIHTAHMAIAEEARIKLKLDEVVFVPAGKPWMKRKTPISKPQDRLNMVIISISSNAGLSQSSIEIDKNGPSYTIDTVTEFQKKVSSGTQLFFILGGDAIQQFHLWRQPKDILSVVQLIVAPRPGNTRIEMKDLEQKVPGISSQSTVLDMPLLDISSRDIRARVSLGQPIRHLVHNGVENYIYKHGLYQRGETNVRD